MKKLSQGLPSLCSHWAYCILLTSWPCKGNRGLVLIYNLCPVNSVLELAQTGLWEQIFTYSKKFLSRLLSYCYFKLTTKGIFKSWKWANAANRTGSTQTSLCRQQGIQDLHEKGRVITLEPVTEEGKAIWCHESLRSSRGKQHLQKEKEGNICSPPWPNSPIIMPTRAITRVNQAQRRTGRW